MAPVHDRGGLIEARLKAPLVGVELEGSRLNPARVGEHAVGGDDDIGFDRKGADHAARYSWLSELTSDRNSCRVCA